MRELSRVRPGSTSIEVSPIVPIAPATSISPVAPTVIGRLRGPAFIALAVAIGLATPSARPRPGDPRAADAQEKRAGDPTKSVEQRHAAGASLVAAPDPDPVQRILREALGRGQAYAKLRALCTSAPKRLSGSAGAAAAVQWAQAAMIQDGLAEVRLEDVLVPCWVRGRVAELAVESPADAQTTHLPILALGGSVATPPEGVSGELVAVESFEELRALAGELPGKIVLFNRPMDPSEPDTFAAYGGAVEQRGRGALEAGKLGAVAAIVRSMTTRIDDTPHTGAMRYEDGAARIPAAAVSTAGAERLAALLRAGKKPVVRLTLDCQTQADVPSHNVVGELPGTSRPDEIVLVVGHLDAWDVGQGAHDDGAGCVQAIEALRLLKSLGLTPKRTLRAVLFMNEENGLRGGKRYREAHAAELERHVLALESDRGGFAPRGFGTNANPSAFETLRAICTRFDRAGGARLEPGDGGADISPLERDGIILMEFLPDPQRYFDVHHSVRDTLDTVHPRELELGAGWIAAMIWSVGMLDEPLPRNAPK